MRVFLKLIFCFLLICFTLFHSFGQEKPDSIRVVETDSMIFVRLEQVNVFPQKGRKLNYRRYSRMVEKIRKVYPFAIAAAKELEIYNEKFENAESEREKRKYVKHVEKDLFAQHEDELKRFTITEGRYLMLLIDRETGNTSYSIIKEIKGGVPAVFWQGIAKIFNNDLKEEYDPQYKHYVIEQIVLMIEQEYEQKAVKPSE